MKETKQTSKLNFQCCTSTRDAERPQLEPAFLAFLDAKPELSRGRVESQGGARRSSE